MIFLAVLSIGLLAQTNSAEYVGSIVYRCHQNILYTQKSENEIPELNNYHFETFNSNNFTWRTFEYSSKECFQTLDDVVKICKKIYGSGLIEGAIHGPSMFPIPHSDAGYYEYVRPFICVSNQNVNFKIWQSISDDKFECKQNTLTSSGLFGNSNASFDQATWETYARKACEATDTGSRGKSINPKMQLYQTNMIMSDPNSFKNQGKFLWSGIEFICCPKRDAADVVENKELDELAKTIELTGAFDFNPPVITRSLETSRPSGPVIGSFVVKCNKFLAYTRPGGYIAAEPNANGETAITWIHIGSGLKDSFNKICSSIKKEQIFDQSLLLDKCRELYPNEEVASAQFGPAMIKYFDQQSSFGHELRPIWCMAKTSYSIVLPTLNGCQRVRELNRIQGADSRCSHQFELERQGKTSCETDTRMKLYSAYPRVPCSSSLNSYQSLHFVCCPFETQGFMALAQSLQSTAEDLFDENNDFAKIDSLRTELDAVQSSNQVQEKRDQQLLDKKLVFDASKLEQIALTDKNLAKNIADNSLQEALDELMTVWLSHEAKWAQNEEAEHIKIENRLNQAQQVQEMKLDEAISKRPPSAAALQHRLSEVLSVVNSEVLEVLRELEAIRKHQPWRLMPLEWGIGDSLSPAAHLGPQNGISPVWLHKVRSALLDYVETAKKRINELKTLLWQMQPNKPDSDKPPLYSDELTATYNQLQESLTKASNSLQTLDQLAKKQHAAYLVQPRRGNQRPGVPATVADPTAGDSEPTLSNEAFRADIQQNVLQKHARDWDETKNRLVEMLHPYTSHFVAELPPFEGKQPEAPVRPSPHVIPDEKDNLGESWLLFNEFGDGPAHHRVSWSEALPKILTTSVLVLIPCLLILFLAVLVVRLLVSRQRGFSRRHRRLAALLGHSSSSSLNKGSPTKEIHNKNYKIDPRSGHYRLVQEELVDDHIHQPNLIVPSERNPPLNGYENPSFTP